MESSSPAAPAPIWCAIAWRRELVSQRRPINEVADLLGHRSIDTTAIYVKVALAATRRCRPSVSWGRVMSSFAKILAERVESLHRAAPIARLRVQQSRPRYCGRWPDTLRPKISMVRSRRAWRSVSFFHGTEHRTAAQFVTGLFAVFAIISRSMTARTEALDPRTFPRSRAIPPPRILTDEELGSLMSACRHVSPGYPERSAVLTVFVGLLASTGLRSGEARRLDRADVDLVEGVLHIRKTKFRK